MIRGALPPITTRQSLVDDVQLFDDDDGSLIDLTGCTIQISIAREWPGPWSTGPFGPDYDADFVSPAPFLTATTADGTVYIADLGTFVFTFTAAQIGTLCAGQYVVGCNISRDDETAQLLLGTLSVLDGVVPQ